jgi:signal-transduction protein with cAMP-binding, CBS, and nucleotidyltransferase domain
MNTSNPNMILLYSGFRYREEASSDDWARVVRAFPLFAGIRRRSLRKLVRQARLLEFVSGEAVMSRDEPPGSIYVVLGGTAMARGATKARTFDVGDHFGDVGRFDGGLVGTTVVAVSQLHVMRLPCASFHRHRQPGRAISFVRMRSRRGRPLTTEPAGWCP